LPFQKGKKKGEEKQKTAGVQAAHLRETDVSKYVWQEEWHNPVYTRRLRSNPSHGNKYTLRTVSDKHQTCRSWVFIWE
jgi:hypothetical protein